jgi:methionine salvage enolase-phosphatase E1
MLTGWIDQDRKMAPALQGMIWDEGHRQGAFERQLMTTRLS